MNFSQFLTENQESPHIKQIKPQIQEIQPPNIKKVITRSNTNKKPKEKEILQPTSLDSQDIEITHEKFKKGDFIIITRMENSSLNVYKGYFGEIKEIIKNGEIASVVLEAMHYPKPIRFPIGHFKRRIFQR